MALVMQNATARGWTPHGRWAQPVWSSPLRAGRYGEGVVTVTDKNESGTDREQAILAMKIAVGFVVGAIMMGIVGPIILAIVIGLATGH